MAYLSPSVHFQFLIPQTDHQQVSQNQHPLSGETDGRTLADYRPLQAPTRRQTGVRQDALDLWSLGSSKNYWSMCKKLKKVMEACGIEKSISFHCGRHSFATLALSKGMPIESVSRVLGHTNIVTTQIYAKITSQKLDNDLTMLGNKLNASFKGLKMA